MEKARLIIRRDNAETDIPVLFNPEEYNLSRSVNYAKISIPGLDNPILQFISGQQTTLTLTLHFDTTNGFIPTGASPDVRDHTDRIISLLHIDGALRSPPTVTFCWGSFSFTGVITDAKQSFTMFQPDGKPVRSKLDLTFEAVKGIGDVKGQSVIGLPSGTKARYLEQESALWRLAWAEYGDPAMWRLIAEANGIHNPRLCPYGQYLKIPPL